MKESTKRTEAMQQAAECRERAAQYDVLANEAKQRGDNEMSANFASSAYEERNEARRIEEGIGKFVEQKSAPARSRR
jgi:rubrerythrin